MLKPINLSTKIAETVKTRIKITAEITIIKVLGLYSVYLT